MLKKILAASSAAVVAVSALASTAMAADNDTIVIQNEQKWENVTVELTAEMTPNQIRELLQYDAGKDKGAENTWMVKTDDDSKNSYSSILLSLWSADAIANNGNAWVSGSYIPFKFLGGTINVDIQGVLKDMWLIQNGTVVAPAVNDGTTNNAPTWAADLTDVIKGGKVTVDNTNGIVTPLGIKGGPAGYTVDNRGDITAVDALNTIKGSYNKAWTKELTVSKDTGWRTSYNTTAGYASVPVIANAAFGLSATTNLENIDFNRSSVKAVFSVEMSKDTWKKIVSPAVSGDWNWDAATWTDYSALFNTNAGSEVINNYFGIVGESGTGSFNHVAGTSEKISVKVTKFEEQSGTYLAALPLVASVPIGVGQNANIPTLKAMNNGGTVKFEFDKDLSSAIVTGTIIYYGTSGQVALPIDSDFGFEDGGKTLVMNFPANLTYDPKMNNVYNSFKASYNISVSGLSGVVTADPSHNTNFADTDKYTGNLVKITFTANAEAPKTDDTSSKEDDKGGLVESNNSTSTPSNNNSTPAPSTNTNNNTEKNPGTGVAVAVAPVLVAATAAAVVISKKRK